MKLLTLLGLVFLALVVGGLLSYAFLPHNITKTVTVNNTIVEYKNHTVYKNNTVYKYINQCSSRTNTQTPHVTYYTINNTKIERVTGYKNEPSYCAKMHNRSLC